MITIHLTGEYNPETDELEVVLPEGIDPTKLTIKRHHIDNASEVKSELLPTWTEAELDEMLKEPEKPMTGAEIVAWLKQEGGWEDLGISDGAEWSIEQRRKIEGRYQW